jgi:predicted alpha/beta-hydrolase family hydrolase
MGGRVALEVAKTRASLRGIVLFSYPLSPPGRDAERVPREALLRASTAPVRIVQGSRDAFGGEAVMTEIVASLAPRVSLELLAGGDHGLEIGKIARAGRTADEVWRGLGASAGVWVRAQADARTSSA